MPPTSRRRRIVIVSGASLAWNPRVLKEAAALAQADLEVTVLGASPSRSSLDHDTALASRGGFAFRSVSPLDQDGMLAPIRAAGQRARNKLGAKWHQLTGVENRFQLGPRVDDLLACARSLEAALYIAHLEPGMWVGARLMEDGQTVGVDLEDWYSEDLLPEARAGRPLRTLRRLEETLLQRAAHRTCPSHAMADALSSEFHCPPPTTIYNAFPWSERLALDDRIADRHDPRVPSIHWYSQSLGPGRGLEDLLAALPRLSMSAEVHLRGFPVKGFEAWMEAHLPADCRKRVFVHDPVSNDELLSRIAEHDIGFAGEMKFCRSRELTVTNKILHYMLGGLAIVASDTAGQAEIAAKAPGAVRLYPSGRPDALAELLNGLLESARDLAAAKRAALGAARDTFCWERQAPLLLASVEAALA